MNLNISSFMWRPNFSSECIDLIESFFKHDPQLMRYFIYNENRDVKHLKGI